MRRASGFFFLQPHKILSRYFPPGAVLMSASAAIPVLISLGKIVAQYGPLVVEFLINSGLLKLPDGVSFPLALKSPHASANAADVSALTAIQAELDVEGLAGHAGELNRLYLDARSGNLAHTTG
jgi:hypothetical protein